MNTDDSMGSFDKFKEFLERPGPTHKTVKEWEKECLSLGEDAPKVFLDSLAAGSQWGVEQERAIQGLRLFGYEVAYGGDEGTDSFVYLVRAPRADDWTVIKPRIVPQNYFEATLEEAQKNLEEHLRATHDDRLYGRDTDSV